jgi:hypothetical protein
MPPTAPTIDFDASKQVATSLHDAIISLFSQWTTPGFVAEMVASAAGGIIFMVAFVLLAAMQVVIAIGSWVGGSFLDLIEKAKGENQDAINGLLAATTNEMLGTHLSASDLSAGSGSATGMDNNQVIGDQLLKIFEESFGGGQPVTSQQGADNARKFAGFAVSFATSQGFLSILAEAASLGFLKEFHELPEGLMHSLGLGRLQRVALQPLIHTAIQLPYQRFCMAQYRPTHLPEAQLVRALHSGQMNEGDVRTQLQELGYADELIQFILTDFQTRLSLSELVLLLRNGDISEQDAINNLTLAGMPEDQAKLQLKAADLASAKTEQTALLSALETAAVDGFVDEGTFSKVLGEQLLGDLEEQNYRAKVGFRQETPRKRVSFAQVKTAIIDNLVDFTYLDTWLAAEGYDTESQTILSFEILQAVQDAQKKAAGKAHLTKKVLKAGKTVPPPLQ